MSYEHCGFESSFHQQCAVPPPLCPCPVVTDAQHAALACATDHKHMHAVLQRALGAQCAALTASVQDVCEEVRDLHGQSTRSRPSSVAGPLAASARMVHDTVVAAAERALTAPRSDGVPSATAMAEVAQAVLPTVLAAGVPVDGREPLLVSMAR